MAQVAKDVEDQSEDAQNIRKVNVLWVETVKLVERGNHGHVLMTNAIFEEEANRKNHALGRKGETPQEDVKALETKFVASEIH